MTLTEYFTGIENFSRDPSAESAPTSRPPHMTEACLQDRTSSKFLEAEIAWQELNSSTLPKEVLGSKQKILGRFRERAARFIHPNFLSADCGDVTCVYSKVYRDRQTAELAYLFFLVTDVVLSAVPALSPISPNSPPALGEGQINNFLFKPVEVERLTTQALYLTARHNRLFSNKSLSGIMRFEHGMQWAGNSACGQAISSSHILLMDSCLNDDFWHLGFTHEVAHHFDFLGFLKRSASSEAVNVINKLGPANDYISEQSSWMKLSGWKVVETVNPTTGGRALQWKSDLGSEGFVRTYARSTPVEDFADSTAFYFGVFGRSTTAPIQSKVEYITELLLSKGFEPPLRTENELLVRRTNAVVDLHLDKFLELCMVRVEKQGGEAMLASAQTCVLKELKKLVADEIEFANFEGYGCESASANAQLAESYLKKQLPRVSQSVSTLLEIENLKIARGKMRERVNARTLFLKASLHSSPSEAYASLLSQKFAENVEIYAGIKSFNSAFELDLLRREEDFNSQQKAFREKLLGLLPPQTISRLAEEGWRRCTRPPFNDATSAVPSLAASIKLDFQHPFLRASIKPCLTNWIEKTSEVIGKQLVPEVSKALLVHTADTDSDVLNLASIFSQDLIFNQVNLLASKAIETEEAALDKLDEDQRASIRDAFKSANLTALPIFQQKDVCWEKMQEAVFKLSKPRLDASFLSNTNKIMKRHQSICALNLESTENYRKEIANHERKLIRRLFSGLNQKDPGTFSFKTRVEGYGTMGVSLASCLGRIRELTKDDKREFADWPTELVEQAFKEVCLIGRYAGRFLFVYSERPVLTSGEKYLGTTSYFDAGERSRLIADKEEIRYYLEAEKKFLAFRSELEMQSRHRNE